MDTIMKLLYLVMVVWAIFVVGYVGYLIIDNIWVTPTADNNANNYCKDHGFDQFKSYSRVGLLSTVPVGIKCEYAEKYTDLGVRSN